MKTVMGMGANRTGIGTSPFGARATIDGAEEGVPIADGDGVELAALRGAYARSAEPLGSVPPPTSLDGVAMTVGQMLTGKQPTVLLDKLGERLAFERTGTRLYEALIAKMEAAETPLEIPIAEIRRFHDEELAHFELVVRAIEGLGGDPTVQTPSADVDGVASMGLLQVITDPRTSVLQALHAIHIAELADNDSWMLLLDLAERMGQVKMAAELAQALREEQEHLACVRMWMSEAVTREAGLDTAPST